MMEYVVAFVIGLAIGIGFLSSVWSTDQDRIWHQEAISRGYGYFCPDTGRFAWKGECEVVK